MYVFSLMLFICLVVDDFWDQPPPSERVGVITMALSAQAILSVVDKSFPNLQTNRATVEQLASFERTANSKFSNVLKHQHELRMGRR